MHWDSNSMKGILKAGLKNYSALLLCAFVLSCFAQRRDGSFSEPSCETYELKDGKVVCMSRAVHAVVPISGIVLHLSQNADELYYVRAEKPEDTILKVGFNIPVRGISQEVVLPKEIQHNNIVRLCGAGGAAFLVAGVGEKEGRALYRIDFNSGKISHKKGIMDVALYDGTPVILFKSERGYALSRNGIKVPLSLKGNPKFGTLFEGRILTVVDGDKKELVDLGIMKNIHGFGGAEGTADISEENLHIEVMDAVSDKMEALVFYKVFVNGTDSGRTDTGPAGQGRKFSVKLAEDEYHIIRLERWELHEGKNAYERANNIYQPKPIKIFLPQHRETKLVVVREKKGYASSWMTLQK